jgi:hypothetical protein
MFKSAEAGRRSPQNKGWSEGKAHLDVSGSAYTSQQSFSASFLNASCSSFTTRDPVRKGGELSINMNMNKIKKIGDVP